MLLFSLLAFLSPVMSSYIQAVTKPVKPLNNALNKIANTASGIVEKKKEPILLNKYLKKPNG